MLFIDAVSILCIVQLNHSWQSGHLYNRDLFNDAVCTSGNINLVSNDRNQLERTWKKAAVSYFMLFCRPLPGGSDKSIVKSQNGRRPDKNSRPAPPSTRLKQIWKLKKTQDRSLSTATKGELPKTVLYFWHDRVTVVFYTENLLHSTR